MYFCKQLFKPEVAGEAEAGLGGAPVPPVYVGVSNAAYLNPPISIYSTHVCI